MVACSFIRQYFREPGGLIWNRGAITADTLPELFAQMNLRLKGLRRTIRNIAFRIQLARVPFEACTINVSRMVK